MPLMRAASLTCNTPRLARYAPIRLADDSSGLLRRLNIQSESKRSLTRRRKQVADIEVPSASSQPWDAFKADVLQFVVPPVLSFLPRAP